MSDQLNKLSSLIGSYASTLDEKKREREEDIDEKDEKKRQREGIEVPLGLELLNMGLSHDNIKTVLTHLFKKAVPGEFIKAHSALGIAQAHMRGGMPEVARYVASKGGMSASKINEIFGEEQGNKIMNALKALGGNKQERLEKLSTAAQNALKTQNEKLRARTKRATQRVGTGLTVQSGSSGDGADAINAAARAAETRRSVESGSSGDGAAKPAAAVRPEVESGSSGDGAAKPAAAVRPEVELGSSGAAAQDSIIPVAPVMEASQQRDADAAGDIADNISGKTKQPSQTQIRQRKFRATMEARQRRSLAQRRQRPPAPPSSDLAQVRQQATSQGLSVREFSRAERDRRIAAAKRAGEPDEDTRPRGQGEVDTTSVLNVQSEVTRLEAVQAAAVQRQSNRRESDRRTRSAVKDNALVANERPAVAEPVVSEPVVAAPAEAASPPPEDIDSDEEEPARDPRTQLPQIGQKSRFATAAEENADLDQADRFYTPSPQQRRRDFKAQLKTKQVVERQNIQKLSTPETRASAAAKLLSGEQVKRAAEALREQNRPKGSRFRNLKKVPVKPLAQRITQPDSFASADQRTGHIQQQSQTRARTVQSLGARTTDRAFSEPTSGLSAAADHLSKLWSTGVEKISQFITPESEAAVTTRNITSMFSNEPELNEFD